MRRVTKESTRLGQCYEYTIRPLAHVFLAIAARIGSTDSVNTLVIVHPDPLTAEQIRAIKVPTSCALTKDDSFFKDKSVKAARAIFKEKEKEKEPDHVDYEFRVWKGTTHGFALRPNLNVREVKAAYEGSLAQTWFKKML